MRQAILPVVLLSSILACGSAKLTRSEATKDISQDYPVVVTVDIPERASAVKGSVEHAKLVKLAEAVAGKGWFNTARGSEGDRETFAFSVAPGAPQTIQTSPKGFTLPAAHGEFAGVKRLEMARDRARVSYDVRLARPTPFFPLFQIAYPKANVGALQERHANYVKEGRQWVLNGTDERFRKGQ